MIYETLDSIKIAALLFGERLGYGSRLGGLKCHANPMSASSTIAARAANRSLRVTSGCRAVRYQKRLSEDSTSLVRASSIKSKFNDNVFYYVCQ